MLKFVGFAALWLVASCAAIAVAWAGVSTVGDEIVAPAPAPTSTAAAEPIDDSPTSSGDAAVDEAGDSASVPESPTTSAGNEDSAPQPAPTTSAGQVDGNGLAPNSGPTTTTSSPPTSTTAAPTPTTTGPPTTTAPPTTVPAPTTTQPEGATETFVLVGGTTSVRYEAGDVTVLWATPNDGFTVDIEPESPGWKVEFRSDTHRSRVDVWWSNGPQSEIREEPEA